MSDINELMRKDPLSCSKIDIQTVVAVYREKRAQYQLGNKMAGRTSVKLTAKETAAASVVDLSKLEF